MPTCLPTTVRSSPTLAHVSSEFHRRIRSSIPPHVKYRRFRRKFSTSKAVAALPGHEPPEVPSIRHQTSTALHKSQSLLSRVRNSNDPSSSLDAWERLLESTHEDLSKIPSSGPTKDLKARVVVYACGGSSGAEELITALLEEPFASDEAQNERIRDRRKVGSRVLYIETNGAAAPADDAILRIASSWLSQFPFPVRLAEVTSSSKRSESSLPTAETALHTADVPIIVCNPLTTDIRTFINDVLPCPLNPNTIIVFTSSPLTSSDVRIHLETLISTSQISRSHPSPFSTVAEEEIEGAPSPEGVRLLFVDPSRALSGLRALKSGFASLEAVQKYQDDFTSSKVSSVTESLSTIFSSLSKSKNDPSGIVQLRTSTAQSIVRGSLRAYRASLAVQERELVSLDRETSRLRDQLTLVASEAHVRVLGTEGGEGGDKVGKALKDAEEGMREVMRGLTLWKAVWRVDEIGQIVAGAMERTWCKRLEAQLILRTGELSATQQHLEQSTRVLLSHYSYPSIFYSPILHNAIAQISNSPSHPLSPQTLTHPLHTRLNQILEYPTTRLHLSAQRVVLGTASSVLGGVGLGLAGWAGWFTSGPIAWVFGVSGGMDVGTAVGVGAVGALVGVRWMVGRWEKAKRAWWRDWRRVGEGMRRDLKEALDRAIREQVTLVPRKACDDLDRVATKRKQEIEKLHEEIDALDGEVTKVAQRSS